MPLLYTDEQNQIRAEARRFLAAEFSAERLRGLLETPGRYDERFWQGCRDMGWTDTAISEMYGGLGLTPLDLCIIAEECGRVAAGAPFLAPSYVLADALARWGAPDDAAALLPELAVGAARGALALLDTGLSLQNGKVSGQLKAVTGGAAASHVLALAGDALAVIDLSAATRHPVGSFDNSRCVADLDLRGAPALILDTPDAQAAALSSLARLAIVLAFEQIGGAEAAMTRARDYALERQAFGQPIGRFQSIKHRIAEMYVAIELARGAALRAALSLTHDSPMLLEDAAAARLCATDAYEFAAREAMQTHGGIGVTWEHDLHLFYRRSRALAVEAGSLLLWEDLLIDRLQGATP